MKVRKAVFPAAGLGTRFLPATKAQPKEMLPLVDKPMIQYVVEEAVASGLSEIIIVTGRGKRAIEDQFDAAFELEYYLNDRGKMEELAQIKTISELASVAVHAAAARRGRAVSGTGDCGPARPTRAHPSVRSDRHPAGRGPRARGPRPGREARTPGGAVRPGHHRPICPAARALRDPRRDAGGSSWRDPADRRSAGPAKASPDVRRRIRGHALRHRRQDWVPQGHRR